MQRTWLMDLIVAKQDLNGESSVCELELKNFHLTHQIHFLIGINNVGNLEFKLHRRIDPQGMESGK
jgi:hypothetical protein